jgi:hypothetical protein
MIVTDFDFWDEYCCLGPLGVEYHSTSFGQWCGFWISMGDWILTCWRARLMPGLRVRYKVIYTAYEANADNTNAIRRQTCFDTVAEFEHSRKQDGTDLKTLYRMLNKGLGHLPIL